MSDILDLLDNVMAMQRRATFDTVLISPQAAQQIRETFPSFSVEPTLPETLLGMKLVVSPLAPREPKWPEGVLRQQPWWLSDEAWARHKQWMGDFFGWVESALLMNQGVLLRGR